ncbi:MAG: 3-carboxy-cis,cis-muconate cycloisomerase [Solirubrobacterales bacterium]|nr:3-carboxy-cis,cis-muconate cycloisomerase [Solirubrobacterales bacterium]
MEGTFAPTFTMLDRLYAEPVMQAVFDEQRCIEYWLDVERALAVSQGQLGIIDPAEAAAVVHAARAENIDSDALWAQAKTVGYPIMGLVRAVAANIPSGVPERVHDGATTQDIMDSALAMMLRDAVLRLIDLNGALGDAIAAAVELHADTVMAGRTHALQAVPTTYGAKMAVFLAQLKRHHERLDQLLARVSVVSLHGAAGTSAALGPRSAELRAAVAMRLGLSTTDVPWHVARDSVLEFGQVCTQVAATAARLAREVIDLSRTEIAEVAERGGHHHGASSTMPQKRNPIGSEAVVGLASTVYALSSALPRAAEAGHERAAGEWQIEWYVVPHVACLTAAALAEMADVARGLSIRPTAMAENLAADGGLLMAEAYMIGLAARAGRQAAHDVVYAASETVRATGMPLVAAVAAECARSGIAAPQEATPDSYLGEAQAVCDRALADWKACHNRRPSAVS